ncbi:hypothetical protein HYV82_04090 [Candidatus Woesearchaeota archaeon]|nr:hypothetical protein [Candidatus Woesearchaeota archaeon]
MGWLDFLKGGRKSPDEEFLGLCNDVAKGAEAALALAQSMFQNIKGADYSGFFGDRTRMDNLMADMVRKASRMEQIRVATLDRIQANEKQYFSVQFQGLQACMRAVSSNFAKVARSENPTIKQLTDAEASLHEMTSGTGKKDLPTLKWHAQNLANTIISSQRSIQAS